MENQIHQKPVDLIRILKIVKHRLKLRKLADRKLWTNRLWSKESKKSEEILKLQNIKKLCKDKLRLKIQRMPIRRREFFSLILKRPLSSLLRTFDKNHQGKIIIILSLLHECMLSFWLQKRRILKMFLGRNYLMAWGTRETGKFV